MGTQRQHEAKRLRRAADQAERDALDAFRRAYPVAAEIAWTFMSDVTHHGWVQLHGHGDRVKVQNEATGRSYWIPHSRVLDLIR